MIDLHFDPYNRNYVITMEVSPELAAALENDPEARKVLADTLQSTILPPPAVRPAVSADATCGDV